MLTPVTDPARIAKVLRHPAIFPHIADDTTPGDWQPTPSPSCVYLMPDDDAACFVFNRHSGAMVEGHLAVLPEHRIRAVPLGSKALGWLRSNTDARAVIGYINADNLHARRYVERLGFVASATVPSGGLKGGRHMDVIFYIKGL